LDALLLQTSFTLRQLREVVPFELPAFVTRVVHDLERDGFLREGEEGSFRWANDATGFAPDMWLDDKLLAPRLAQTPEADRPRERLLAQGAASLKVAELLAILIRSGQPGESALQAGDKIAAHFTDHLEDLALAGPGELKRVAKSVAKTAYCQIMAGIELGRRVAQAQAERPQPPVSLKSSAEALSFCREHFARLAADAAQEEFHVVCLDTKNQVLRSHCVSVGAVDRTLVHPREVFRPAIKDAAKTILLVHNHPSGDPTPSEDDFTLTSRLQEAGKTLGISILDHIIVARGGLVSIREAKSRSDNR